jgi:hypothetical protein
VSFTFLYHKPNLRSTSQLRARCSQVRELAR